MPSKFIGYLFIYIDLKKIELYSEWGQSFVFACIWYTDKKTD